MLHILTNDDGIDAPGLAALHAAIANLPGDHLLVAPHEAVSECSHRVTTKDPLRIDQRGPHAWAVEGSPADCTRVALLHLAPHHNGPVRVLSGINAGGNLGADIYISGTVAAAREAAFHGIPAVALSHVMKTGIDLDWSRAARWALLALEAIDAHTRQHTPPPGAFWNVNFPALPPTAPPPPVRFCPRSRHPLPVKYTLQDNALHYNRGLYHTRTYEPDSDVALCFAGNITISLLEL